jgi:hypothetical protein
MVLEAVKGRAPRRTPQAVSSLDRSCAPWPLGLVGTKGVPWFRPPLAGRTKGGSGRGDFRGSSASARRVDGRIDMLRRAQAFGYEVSMLAQPVAGTLDVDDHGVMKQPVEQRGGDHWITEHCELPLISNG